MLQLSWDVSEGVPPVSVKAEIAYPDKHIENMELRFIRGAQTFPVTYPEGGTVKVKVAATDAGEASSRLRRALSLPLGESHPAAIGKVWPLKRRHFEGETILGTERDAGERHG